MFKIIRKQEYKIVPWKNGRGQTQEIAVQPESATLDDFDWRVSMASVAASGPFSKFPGVSRHIILLTGMSVTLDHPIRKTNHRLMPFVPYTFEGEEETNATVSAPGLDFNVMTRHGRFKANLDILQILPGQTLTLNTGIKTQLVFCAMGALTLGISAQQSIIVSAALGLYDTCVIPTPGTSWTLTGDTEIPRVTAIVVTFTRLTNS